MKDKIITGQQIENLVATFYETNIPAKQLDAVRNFLYSLPNVPEPKADQSTLTPPPPIPMPKISIPSGKVVKKTK